MSPEKQLLGWYLHNAMQSDCADRLDGTVGAFALWLDGRLVIPERRRRYELAQLQDGPMPPREEIARLLAPFAVRPPRGADIIETNTALAAGVLGLEPLDCDLLLLALHGGNGGFMEQFLCEAWEQADDVARFAASLLGVAAVNVQARLTRSAPLPTSGLLRICLDSYMAFNQALHVPLHIRSLMRTPCGSAAAWAQAVLGEPARSDLRWSDFDHVQPQADMAARVLRRAAQDNEAGVHILLVGPPGTGKTELSKALAARADLRLFAAAEQSNDEDDSEPSRSERLGMLRLSASVLGQARDAILLLDEAEDVLEAPHSFGEHRDSISKMYLHRTLESMATPVIWTCNTLFEMDPATVRRMTMVIAVPVPDVTVRTRIWTRVLTRERLRLPADAPSRLAARWEASAGIAAGAARAARLSGGCEKAVERALKGVMIAMGAKPCPPALTSSFDPDLVACDFDLKSLCERLAQPGTSRAWSLCVSGPSGTGKSEFARHLAGHLGLKVIYKRASDLLSMFVGGSEQAIAGAFREAAEAGAMLVIDEAEAMLFNREAATRSWEVSQVDEMLTWMERHPLPFVCTTNMPDRLDAAVSRRFTLKLHFKALDMRQATLAFRRLLEADPPGSLPDALTPGDFAVVRKKAALFAERNPRTLLAWLQEEVDAKLCHRGLIGFRVPQRQSEPQPQATGRLSPGVA